MKIEITYRESIYKQNAEDPENPILVKRNVVYKNMIDTKDIKVVSWYYNKRGQKVKSKCTIFHNDLGAVTVDTPYEKMKEYVHNNRNEVKGFRNK